MELWQIANYFKSPEEQPPSPGAVPSEHVDLMKRVAAYKAGLPDPADTAPTEFNPVFAELLGVPAVE